MDVFVRSDRAGISRSNDSAVAALEPPAEMPPQSAASLPYFASGSPFGRFRDRLSRDVDTAAGAAVLLAAFLATNLERMPQGLDGFLAARLTIKNVLFVLAFGVIWRLVCIGTGLYDRRAALTPEEETRRVLTASGFGSLIALVFPAISVSGAFRASAVLGFWAGTSVIMLAHRAALRALLASRLRTREDIVIVGSGPRAMKIYRQLDGDPESCSNVVGFIDSNEHHWCEEIRDRSLGRLDQLESILMGRAIDRVLITLPVRSCYAEVQSAIRTCARIGVRATYLADVFEYPYREPRFEGTSRFPLVALPVAPDDQRLLVKRVLDIAIGVVALTLAIPILALAAAAIKLSSPGPAFFAQQRYGLNRRLFRMFKLRTMVVDAEARQNELEDRNEATGPVFKIKDDPRITPVGRILRRTSIDELPQLVNVIRSEMSLVGPRPMAVRDVHRFTEAALMRRFSMPPGITCLWQISGRSSLGFHDWIRLDLKYIDEWSLSLDFRILARTLPAVLRRTGAA